MESSTLKSKISYNLSKAWVRATRGIRSKSLNCIRGKTNRAILIFGRNSQRYYAEVLRAKKDIVILRIVPQKAWNNRLKGGCTKKVRMEDDDTSPPSKQNCQSYTQRLAGNIEKDLQCLQTDLCKMKYYCSPEDLLNFCRVLKRLQAIVNCFCELRQSLQENESDSKKMKKPEKHKEKRSFRKKEKNKKCIDDELKTDSYRSSQSSLRSTNNNGCPQMCEELKNQKKECKKRSKSGSNEGLATKKNDGKKNCERTEECRESLLKTTKTKSTSHSSQKSNEFKVEECCENMESKKSKTKKIKKKDSVECLREKRGKKPKCPKPRKGKSNGCASLVTIYKAPPAVEKFCCSCYGKKVRIVKKNLAKELMKIIGKKRSTIFLKISAIEECLYHLQIVTVDNCCLGCFYVTQKAMNAAIKNKDFDNYITLSLISSSNSLPDVRDIVKYPFVSCK